MPWSSWRWASTLLTLALCGYTVHRLHRQAHAPYQCEMTYMHPSYQRVNVSSGLAGRYGLYTYEETEARPPLGALLMA